MSRCSRCGVSRSSSLRTFLRAAAGAGCGIGAWFSLGLMALVPEEDSVRHVGLLPPTWWLVPFCAGPMLLSVWLPRIPSGLLALPVVAAVPWLGITAPALLIWSGPALLAVWALVITGVARAVITRDTDVHRDRARVLGRTAAPVAPTSALVLALFAWAVFPLGPSGDEPHYLLIATSILEDGDLDLANDYTDERYLTFYPGPLTPRHVVHNRRGQEHSFHGHGVALLALPGFALGGVVGARTVLLLVSVFGIAWVWSAARLLSSSSAATAALAALVCSTPFLAQSSAIYPDGPGAAIVSLALLTAVRLERGGAPRGSALAATGAALSALPWLHVRFAILAAAFGFAIVWLLRRREDRVSHIAVFLAVPTISFVLLMASTWVMFDTLDPTAAFHQKAIGSLSNAPVGLLGLLADHEYGLLVYAPAFALTLGGLYPLWRQTPVTMLAGLAALGMTLLTGASYVWWGGTTSPARFLVPVLPVLVLALATWWAGARSWMKSVGAALITTGAAVAGAIALADRGRYMTSIPDARLSIFEWANTLVDLPSALPSLFRPEATFMSEALVACCWIVLGGITFGALAVTRERSGAHLLPLTSWGIVLWISASASVTWALRPEAPVTADRSQLALVQSSLRPWLATGFIARQGTKPPDAVLAGLAFTAPAPDDRSVLLAPRLPAGRYRVVVEDAGEPATFALEVGRDAWPLRTFAAGSRSSTFTLALPVHSVRVTTDAAATPKPRAFIEVQQVLRSRTELVAENLTRYGDLYVYTLDAAPTLETGGFWLPGGRSTAIVVTNQAGVVNPVALTLEASEPVTVELTLGAWRDQRFIGIGTPEEFRIPPANRPTPLTIVISGPVSRQAVWASVSSASF